MHVFTPADSIRSHFSSSIICFFLTRTSPVKEFLISSAEYLPSALSAKLTRTFPPSIISPMVIGLSFPQSNNEIITSWETSHNLLVRYPELAVFNAVSAKPLRAPWVDVKYSKIVRPSLKFEIIGVSIISPEGFAINPLIPANCFIWAAEPLAPESAIINTELIWIFPSLSFFGVEIIFIISAAILSVHLDHWSITLLYFSPLVISPSAYWFSYSSTNFLASLIIPFLLSGIIRSSFPKDIPALNAFLNPNVIKRSQKITVSFCPQNLKTLSITSEIFFLERVLLIKSNLISLCFGKILEIINLPAVLSNFLNIKFPFSSLVSNLEMILEWIWMFPPSIACSISLIFKKYPWGFSSLFSNGSCAK